MICLLGLLLLVSGALAQPVDGPFTVAELDSGAWAGFGNLHVMPARGDTVGFFFSTGISGNPTGVYYAEFSFAEHSLVEQPVMLSQNGILQGANQSSDGEWMCGVLDGLTLWVVHGHGLDAENSTPIATGQWRPQCWGDCWTFSNCFFTPRVGGGFVMTMSLDSYFDMGGGMHEIDGGPMLVLFGANGVTVDYESPWPYGYTFGSAVSYPISLAADTTLVVVNSGGGVSDGWWFYEDNNFETEPLLEDTVCAYNLLEITRTPGGRLLGATRGLWQGPYPEAGVIELVPQPDCVFLGGFGWGALTSPDAVALSPVLGCAAVHATGSSVELVRLDTNGVTIVPIGTFAWRDSLHMIYSPDVSVSDDSTIAVAWLEQIAWNEGHRLRIARCTWATPLTATRGTKVIPSQLTLSAYPNPFNATTTFTFTLPRAGEVKLKLFDLLGREVAMIAEGRMETGEHKVSCSPDHLSSGIYFARLETASQSRTQKLVILK